MKHFLLIALSLLISPPSFATDLEIAAENKTEADSQQEEYRPGKIWLGVPASALVGFGIGQGFQGRYANYGWAFTLADTVGTAMVLSTFGCCTTDECVTRQGQRGQTAVAILAASRIAQVLDTSIWSYRYYQKHHPTALVTPREDGAMLSLALSY